MTKIINMTEIVNKEQIDLLKSQAKAYLMLAKASNQKHYLTSARSCLSLLKTLRGL